MRLVASALVLLVTLLPSSRLAAEDLADRLLLDLPRDGSLETQHGGKAWTPTSLESEPGDLAIIYRSADLGADVGPRDVLLRFVQNVTARQKSVEKGSITGVRNEHGPLILSMPVTATDQEGEVSRLTAFVIVTGLKAQPALVSAPSETRHRKLEKEMTRLLRTAAVRFPDAPGPPPRVTEGTTSRFLHLGFQIPHTWQPDTTYEHDRFGYNSNRFGRLIPLGDLDYVAGIGLNVQAQVPADPLRALTRWLYALDLGAPLPEKGTRKLFWARDWRLPSGVQVSGVRWLDRVGDTGWVAQRAGFCVFGPGWSFFVGTAIGNSDTWWAMTADQRKKAAEKFNVVFEELYALVGSIVWDDPPKERRQLVERLIRKKTYRYDYHGNHGSPGGVWVVDEDHVHWTFHPDQTVTVDASSYFGTSQTFRDDPTNRHRITGSAGGTAIGPARRDRASFTVVGDEPTYLVLIHPYGAWTRFHTLTFDATGSYGASKNFTGLAIDGRIEGTYYKGNGYKFRK